MYRLTSSCLYKVSLLFHMHSPATKRERREHVMQQSADMPPLHAAHGWTINIDERLACCLVKCARVPLSLKTLRGFFFFLAGK
jgi:hypothetical protein